MELELERLSTHPRPPFRVWRLSVRAGLHPSGTAQTNSSFFSAGQISDHFSKVEIADKSKGNFFTKLNHVLQTTWK
jgi:hypothetical protein